MRGRPREYKVRQPFNSTMEADTYTRLRKLSAEMDIPMNEIFQEAAEKVLAEYDEGKPTLLKTKEPEIPNLLANADEFLKWAYVVGPEGLAKALDNMKFLIGKGQEQSRALTITWKNKPTKTET